jgi:CTP synthase
MKYRSASKERMIVSGISPERPLVEIVEMKGIPGSLGCQFHPDLNRSPLTPKPLFPVFIKASAETNAERLNCKKK